MTVLTSRRLNVYLYSAVSGNHPYLLFTLCYCRSLSLAFCTPTCLFILNFPVKFLCLSQNPLRKGPNIKLKSQRTSSLLLLWLFGSQQPLHLSLFSQYQLSRMYFYTNCCAVKYLCFYKSNYFANILQQTDKFQYFYLRRTIIPLSLMIETLLRFHQDN